MKDLDVHLLGDRLMLPPQGGSLPLAGGGLRESDFGTLDDSCSLLLTCQWDFLLTKRGRTTAMLPACSQAPVQVITEPLKTIRRGLATACCTRYDVAY